MQVLLTYIWRAWFYVCIAVAIILLFPFIFITSQRSHWYPTFFVLARVWAWLVLLLAGFWPRAVWLQKPSGEKPYIICPNHTSMVDIMLTLALFPHCFLFIGKSELTRLPLFGYFYRKTNILVDRKSMRSRQQAFEKGAEKLKEGVGLCIFPEGGVPDPQVDLARFKVGAFRLAAEHQLPIIPVSFPDNKRHLPYDFKKGYPGILRAVIYPALMPQGPGSEEIKRLQVSCYEKVKSGLHPAEFKEWINEPG